MPRGVLSTAMAILLLAGGLASAADTGSVGTKRWRMVLGPAFGGPSFATTYVSSYSPPLLLFPYSSQATQTMPLDAGSGWGMHAALERELGGHLGLRLAAEWVRSDISGAPGTYELWIRYTSRPPPSYEPVTVALDREEARPAAEGHLDSASLALQLQALTHLGRRARLGLSAGPAWVHSSGWAQSLVYTRYSLGGHSTVFYEDSLVSFDFTTDSLGAAIGAFVDADLGSRVSLRLDLTWLLAPRRDAEVSLRDHVEGDTSSVPIEEIAGGLEPSPVSVDPRLVRVAAAVVVRF